MSPSKKLMSFLGILTIWIWVSGASAHPHFSKEISFRWDREDSPQARKMILRHITVPYNEIKAGELKAGESWHCGFAKLETSAALKNGSTSIPAGQYEIRVRKEEGGAWSMHLLHGPKENKKTVELEERLESDLPVEEHLRFDLHPKGGKDNPEVRIFLRFGPHLLRTAVVLAED